MTSKKGKESAQDSVIARPTSHWTSKKSERAASAWASGLRISPQILDKSASIVAFSDSTGVLPSQSRRTNRRSGLESDASPLMSLRCTSNTVLRSGRFAALKRPTCVSSGEPA